MKLDIMSRKLQKIKSIHQTLLEGKKTYALDQFSFYLLVEEAEQNYYMGVLVEEYNPGKVLVEQQEVAGEEEVATMRFSLSPLPKNYHYYPQHLQVKVL